MQYDIYKFFVMNTHSLLFTDQLERFFFNILTYYYKFFFNSATFRNKYGSIITLSFRRTSAIGETLQRR